MEQWIKDTLGEAPENKEVVEYVTAKGYKTPADAIKAGHEAHKLNTRKTEEIKAEVEKQFVPAEDWKEEQWKAFAERTRTKDRKAYKAEIPENLKPYMKQEKLDAMFDEIHQAGVPAPIANRIVAKYIDGEKAGLEALLTETQRIKSEDQAVLDKEWGADKAKNEELAKRGQDFAAQAAGMESAPFAELLKTYGMDTHPAFKKLFKFIGEASNDPKFVMGNSKPKAKAEKTLGQQLVEEAHNPTAVSA